MSHDTEWTEFPVCPHCGFMDQDWWDGTSLKNDGDTQDGDCPDCEKPYRTVMSVSVHFTTSELPTQKSASPARGQDSSTGEEDGRG